MNSVKRRPSRVQVHPLHQNSGLVPTNLIFLMGTELRNEPETRETKQGKVYEQALRRPSFASDILDEEKASILEPR